METGLVGRFDSFSQEESEKDPRKGKEKNGGGRPEGEAEEGRKAGEDSEDAEAVGGIEGGRRSVWRSFPLVWVE